jgi:tRNA nucleotidyltransferase (CCA-adding enzyme)
MQAARAVPVKPLLARGLKGAELGEAINRERLQALTQFRSKQRQASADSSIP